MCDPPLRQRVQLEKTAAYLQELSELEVAEVFLIVLPKVQTDELAVPFEGDVVMHCGLAEDVTHIFCSTNENSQGWKEKEEKLRGKESHEDGYVIHPHAMP